MHLFAEVVFFSGQRQQLPRQGYRPDAVFNETGDYWGITFTELPIDAFDDPTPAEVRFTIQNSHYAEVAPGQSFAVMEGSRRVGEGTIISIDAD